MNLLSYQGVENYLQNKQVYFKKDIVNSDFKTLAEKDKVHNVGKVELKRLNDTVVALCIQINDIETTLYEHKTDLELFAWIKQNFIPVCELINSYQSMNNAEKPQLTIPRVDSSILFSRVWAMPNSNTFDIKCIRKLIQKYLKDEMVSIDPFANKCKLAKITNDLNPEYDTDYHLDAVDFLKQFEDNSIDFVFYDPPYSLRQVSECYKNVGIPVTMETTQSSWRTKHINEISRILKPNGIVMCFGWNSSGVGKKRGMQLIEVLLVAHGGSHNDTICTVERKLPTLF